MAFNQAGETPAFSVASAGTVTLGNEFVVNRFGFGTMRMPGPNAWGEPSNATEVKAVLRRAVEGGVNFIDTAAYYGPEVANRLIQETLYPYPEQLVIATKVGARRGTDQSWLADMHPERLRLACEDNLRQLRLEQLPLVHCRYMEDADVPFAESVGVLAELQQKGLIRHIGLSNVTLELLRMAQAITSIATVQNFYNVTYRHDEEVLDVCTREQIAYIPFFPLAMGQLGMFESKLTIVAQRHQATIFQIALAWLLARSPLMLPIAGTSSRVHLDENIAATTIRLTDDDMAILA